LRRRATAEGTGRRCRVFGQSAKIGYESRRPAIPDQRCASDPCRRIRSPGQEGPREKRARTGRPGNSGIIQKYAIQGEGARQMMRRLLPTAILLLCAAPPAAPLSWDSDCAKEKGLFISLVPEKISQLRPYTLKLREKPDDQETFFYACLYYRNNKENR